LEHQVAVLDSELVDVRQKRNELTSNLDNVSEELQESRIALEDLINGKDSFEKRFEELSEAYATQKNELSRQVDSNTDAQASIIALKSKIDGLEAEKAELNDQLKEESQKHIAEVDDLNCKLEYMRSEIQIKTHEREMILADLDGKNAMVQLLENELNKLRTSESALLQKLQIATTEIESLRREKDEMKGKLFKETEELKMTKDELIRAHDIVESSNKRLGEMKQKVIDLEDELESKNSMLLQSQDTLQREREKLSLGLLESQRHCRELQSELDTFKSGKFEASNIGDNAKFSDLESENNQLKELLASANISVDDARTAANMARMDLESKKREVIEAYDRISQLEEELETAYTKISALHHPNENESNIRIVLAEKRKLEDILEKERANWKESEAILRRQMSEEQRALIREAEHTMQILRSELSSSQQHVKNLETEAYLARQMKEDLAEKSRVCMQQIDELANKVTFLENENHRLKKAANTHQQNSEKEAQINLLSASLDELKVDNANKQSTIFDLEKVIENLQSEKKELDKKSSRFMMEDHKLESLKLKREIRKLEEEIKRIKENESDSVSKLNDIIRELTQQNDTKDERIKKLQKSKITKEQAAAIKKLKNDYDTCQRELQKIKEENSNLRATFSSESRKMEDSEVTSLRFDKEALERKLRKFAAHCQRLEDEKVGILQSLRSTGLCVKDNSSEPLDIEKSIIALCDRLASLEEECAALSQSERRSSTFIAETEQLKAQNSTLLQRISEAQQQIEKLRQSYDKRNELVNSLQRENDTLRRKVDQNRELESYESEKFNKLRFLEHENLQLINDLKLAKKQLQNTKAELSVLRAQQLNEEFDTLAAQNTLLQSSKLSDKSTPKPSKTPHNKENLCSNRQNPYLSQKAEVTVGSKKRRTPGLGEAFAASEENTQECKNS
jgi:chromosome segregation ATPase